MATVANSTSNIQGDTIITAENDETLMGLKSFDRGSNAPFGVNSGAGLVDNLDADKLDGVHGSDYGRISVANAFTAVQTAANQPRAGAYNNTTQAVADDTATAITFNSEDYDVGTLHSVASLTSRFTVPAGGGGIYLVIGQVNFAADADGFRRVYVRKNGGTGYVGGSVQAVGGAVAAMLTVCTLVSLAAADYVEIIAHHTAGNSLNTGDATSRFLMNSAQIVKLW